MDFEMLDRPFVSTGDPKKDVFLNSLRHSGSAAWMVVGLFVMDRTIRWAGGTELAHMIKSPIKKAGGRMANAAFDGFIKHSWKIGPGLITAAALFKQRSTGEKAVKLSPETEAELLKTASNLDGVSMTEGNEKPTLTVNASKLLEISKILQKEMRFSKSLTDELTSSEVERLFNDGGMSGVNWKIVMDVDAVDIGDACVSDDGKRYSRKLEQFMKDGISKETLEFGCAMLSLHTHAGDVYNDQADVQDYIAFTSKKSTEGVTDTTKTESEVRLSDSFLLNLRNVLEITDEGDLVKSAMTNSDVLEGVSSGRIKNDFELRSILRGTADATRKQRFRVR